jgi:hypothetical protein
MAEERYRVKFEVSGTEEVNQAIANQAKVVADLENTYARLRRQITELRNLRKTIGDVGGISPLAQKMEDLQKQSKGVGISLTAARRNLSELAEGANQAGASFEKMGNSAEAAGRKARKAASGTDNGFSGAVPMGPFRSKKEYDAAVAGLENVNKKTKEVTESTKKLGGASLLATSVFTKAGIPGAEALSVLINQFAVEGLKLKDLLDNFTFKIAAGVGVAAVTFQAMKAVFGSIRADAETILRLTESTAKVTFIGRQGGQSQNKTDLQTLEQAERDFTFFLDSAQSDALSRAQEILRTTIGGGKSSEELQKLDRDIERIDRKRGNILKQFFFDATSNEDLSKAVEAKIAALGGQQSPELLAQKLKQAREEFGKFELAAKGRKEDNIFDQTFDSLRELAASKGQLRELDQFVQGLMARAGSGSLGIKELAGSVRVFRDELQRMSSVRTLNELLDEQFSRINKQQNLADDFNKTRSDLRRGQEVNPILKSLEEAQGKLIEFRKQFSELGQVRLDGLRDDLRKTFEQGIFAPDFTERSGIFKLRTELSRLGAFNVSGNAQALQDEDRDRITRARIREARESGSFANLQVAQAALFGRDAEFRAQIRQATDAGQFVKAAELENQRRALEREDAGRAFGRNALDDEIKFLRERLGTASTDSDRRLVLDRLLDATNGINELTSEQRDARAQGLQQRIALGESERHRVLIKIENSSDFATASAERVLGPEPGSGVQTTAPSASRVGGSLRNNF